MEFPDLRIKPGQKVRLKDHDPGHTAGYGGKEQAASKLQEDIARLVKLQEVLYADNRHALLVILQAMDAAGKDGVIKHVMNGVNPQGCQVTSFKSPGAEDLDHTYLWRCFKQLPAKGNIGIFNRSYYEEVLVVRVHPELLARQNLPADATENHVWSRRFDQINAFERYLHENGVRVVKFFLHVSRDEQKRRFLKRIDRPEKNWKFSYADIVERGFWDQYRHAYEEMLEHTSTEWAPWHVIPADHKWFTRLAVADFLVDALEGLDLRYPEISPEERVRLQSARQQLLAEND